ncbi:MAG: efflux RND transporter permease subunit [Hyphomicrobium sp.]
MSSDRARELAQHVSQPAWAGAHGFGIERLGLFPVRHPRIALALILAITLAGLLSLPWLKSDDSLNDFFCSETTAYLTYERMAERFPASRNDVFVVAEGPDLMAPATLKQLRALHVELELIQGVAGVTSLFSIRENPKDLETPPLLVPDEFPQGMAWQKLAERVQSHPLIRDRLLSDHRQGTALAILVVALDPEMAEERGLGPLIREIDAIAQTSAATQGLRIGLTGVPVMKLEIGEASRRDRIVFNIGGVAVGLIVCLLFFRRLDLLIIANAAPIACVLWTLGLFTLFGVALNPVMNAVIPLLMVIAFTNSMHLAFDLRARLGRGEAVPEAIGHAMRTVGPACVLTSLTTFLALMSIAISDSVLIRTFGLGAAAGTVVTLFCVMLIVPTLSMFVLRSAGEALHDTVGMRLPRARLEALSAWLAHKIEAHHETLAIWGIIITLTCLILYLRVEPFYRLSDITPRNEQAHQVSSLLEDRLAGIHPIQVMVTWPEAQSPPPERLAAAVGEIHGALEAQPEVRNVWSLATLRQWVGGEGATRTQRVRTYLERLPRQVRGRLLSEDGRATLITGFIPDLEAKHVQLIEGRLARALQDVHKRYPEFHLDITGMSVMSAAAATSVIGQLNRSLLIAIAVVVAALAFTFRSVKAAALSILPNMFALVATGALLHVLGWGLEYAGIIALTVAFGLAVDDTIHFLNRYGQERTRLPTPDDATRETIRRIGPILVATTVILVFGMTVSAFSAVPPTALFGQLCIATVIFALLGDLVFLPATIFAAHSWGWLGASRHPSAS